MASWPVQGRPRVPPDCGPAAALARPDLATVVDAWPKLPEALKAGILAMVKAASGGVAVRPISGNCARGACNHPSEL
jgi:hypothetical protein